MSAVAERDEVTELEDVVSDGRGPGTVPERRRRLKAATPILVAVAVAALAMVASTLYSGTHAKPRGLRVAPGPAMSTPAASARSPAPRNVTVHASASISPVPSASAATASGQQTRSSGGTGSIRTGTGSSPGGSGSGGVPTNPEPSLRTSPASSTSSAPPVYTEEAYNKNGVPTFKDHHNASGPGPDIPFQTTVVVVCKVYDPSIPSVVPSGYWYEITTAPWTGLYAAANTFLNGDPAGGPYTHNYDPKVPDC